ncbi:MAG: bifunctional folylpolyglutamate synthase/dihydrofolate synthase [Flavobacteriaceae bacterium]|nr:bifunctional folylpolyglutamate synthase/dihydrofolate synthase [Flavobacteriaceae bacterium]
MNYPDTVNWMFNQLPMYQSQGKSAYKADLKNIQLLASHLGNPESKFKSVHVAGTNGKGSTSHMLASVLQEAGYKVGLYTSPHMLDFRERIRINGKPVSKQFVIQFIRTNKEFFEKNALSFFEMTVGMAFDYFFKKKVDIAVIEVGLGGRLDSTNIIIPEISVITNIGMDHMQFLGSTLEEIAREKAGIIKDGIPVVIGETQKELVRIFSTKSRNRHAPIVFADQDGVSDSYDTDLLGHYQQKNLRTAVCTIKELIKSGWKVSDKHLRNGLKKVVHNTGLRGRWEVLAQNPKIICDTAHNREGLSSVLNQLAKERFRKLHIILGFVADKDLKRVVDLFPAHACYYFCSPQIPRAMPVEKLQEFFDENSISGEACESVKHALEKAQKNAKTKDLIFIGGSTFVVAEALPNFR